MMRYQVPQRLDRPPPSRRIHVTAGDILGTATFAAVVTTVWAVLAGMALPAPALGAAAALALVTAWAFSPPRGVAHLYIHAPHAPAQAREHGHLATAVVEQRETRRRFPHVTEVTWQLLVAGADGRRFRTATAARLRVDGGPAHGPGDVAAVRVHPDQRGVVVLVDEQPPGPAPERPSRPVPRYSGVPHHTRGVVLRELPTALLGLAVMTVGALAPLAAIALTGAGPSAHHAVVAASAEVALEDGGEPERDELAHRQ